MGNCYIDKSEKDTTHEAGEHLTQLISECSSENFKFQLVRAAVATKNTRMLNISANTKRQMAQCNVE